MTVAIPTAMLEDICDLNPRLAEPLRPDTPVSFVPMSSVSAEMASTIDNEDRHYSEVAKGYTPMLNGDVLVAKITPCFENGKIAQATLRRPIGFGSTEFHVIRPHKGKADARYLLHFLRQERITQDGKRRMTGSAGQRRVPIQFLAGLEIPIPPLPEQRRIAAILDQADALRVKRRTTLAQLDTLAQSIFLDIFGNPKADQWEIETVESIAASTPGSIRTGPFGSQLLHSEFLEQGIAVLGIDNVVHNQFRWAERRYISPSKYKELKRYTVTPGDVLITIMGTCGRCAVVPRDIPTAINTKHLCCITLDRRQCLPQFLHAYFLWHPMGRRYLERRAKGAIMSGLNMGIIKDMPIVLPPLGVQCAFSRRLAQVRDVADVHVSSLSHLEALFASLERRAFQGEL